jgi:hypothetical protein
MRTRNSLTILLAAVMVISAPMSAMAADATWNGQATSDWNLILNWTPSTAVPNGAGDIARFHDLITNETTADMNGLAITVQDMYISGTADGYEITNTGGAEVLTAGTLTHSASGTNTISANLTTSGAISVSDGTLVLSGTNAIGGAVNVTGGRLQAAAPPAVASSTINLAGGTFETSGESVAGYIMGQLNYDYFSGADHVGMRQIDDGIDGNGANGGLFLLTPTAEGSRPAAVQGKDPWGAGDGDINHGNMADHYVEMWSGNFHATTPGTNDYTFYVHGDDNEILWMDLDQDGEFDWVDTNTNGVLDSGEGDVVTSNDIPEGWNIPRTTTVSLAQGVYPFAVAHSEGVGGDLFQFKLNGTFVNPGVQNTQWSTGGTVLGAINMSTTNIDVNANSNLVANTDTTAEFGALTLNSGIVSVSGAAGGTTFGGTSAPAAAVTGVTTDTALTLGALTIGAGADVTLGGTTVTATSIDLDTSATIRVIGDVDLGTYNEAGAVALTVAGTGSLDMQGLGATAAVGTAFTTQETVTLKLGGATPLGGSTEDLNLAGGVIQIIGAEVAAPAPAGAIAHYSFDDVAAGVAPDSSGSATTYDGTINGSGATVVAGHIGTGAMDFDGTDGFIGLGANINPLDGKTAWTLAWWSNQDTHQDGAQISSDPNTGSSRFIVQDSGANGPVYANGDVFPDDVNTTMIADSQWHHYALTMDNPVNGTWKFYVDGDLDDTTASKTFTMSDFELRMGQHTGTAWFDGMMDDVYIYDAALDATQVGTLYGGVVTGAINMTSTDVIVTNNSGLDAVTDSTAAFGALSFDGQGILTTSGANESISFTSTTITSATGDIGFETLSDTYAGPIDFNSTGAVIIKTGAADLILDASDPLNAAGASFDVREGRLIAQAGSNPLGDGNAVEINGGEVVLVSSAAGTPATFDNSVTSTGGTLTAGANGGLNLGALIVTVGSAAGNDVTLTSGTLTLQTTDDYTLAIAGNVAGAADLAIGAASTVTVAGTMDAGTVTIDGDLTVAGAVNVTDLIANTGGSYAGPSNLTVANTLTLNGDLNLSAATLVVDNANVTVNGGTLTIGAGNNLGSALTPVASVDVSRGGGLALGGNSLTTKKLATTGGTFDMGATGHFIATGDVTAIPAAGPAHLELTGGVLSIQGAGAEMPASLQFHVNASDINNDGGATNPANGAPITNWADTSGSGNDAGNAWNAPVYNTAGPNGMPVVTFTNDILSTTHNFNDLEGYTMITVARLTGGRDGRVFGSMDRNFLFGFHGTTSDWHADSWIYNGRQTDTDFHLHVGTITNDGDPKASFWDNGVNRVTDNTGSSNTGYRMDRLALGGYRNNSETSNADIAEALIFEGVLSEEDINNIAGYLAAKYGLPGTGYDGSLSGGMNLTGTDLLMSAATTLHITSDVTLGALTVDNTAVSPVELTFTGAVDLQLNLASTSFDAAITGTPGLIVDTEAPRVNLGALDLSGVSDAVDPVMNKEGAGEWIITDTVTGYTGTATYNVNEGTLTLGDTGLIGSQVNVNDGTTLKLSSSIGDTTYAETPTFSGDVAVLAGAADAGSTAAVITLPTINDLSGQTLTLGAEENYTLKITNPISADIVSAIGLGSTTLDNGGAATTSVSLSAGTLNVNNAAIVTPSISVTGTGTLNLGVAQSTDNLLVDTSGTVNVPNTLTVTDKITLGSVVITDDASMDIVGPNLADPTGTITVSGSSFDMGPIVVPAVAPSGAVALYTFESDAGGFTPNSGSGGVALDGAILGDAALAAGKVGQAMSFDGAGDYIDVEYAASLDMSEFTVSAWVNINSEPGNYGILGTRIDGENTFDLKVRGTDIHADIGTGGGWISTAMDIGAGDTGSNAQGGDLAVGQWYQVTYVIDDAAKQFKLYIDGDLKKTIAYTNTPKFMKPGQSLWIGDDYAGHEYMDGLIDEVYIYDRALDGGEVTDLFNVGTPLVGGTVDIDMPNLALDLASGGPSATITLNDATPTLGDLTMGAVTDLTIAVADTASFNNVTVNAGGPTTINNGGAAPGLTVRNTLQTAGGSDLTTSFSANGDLAVTNLNAVGTVGTPITVSAKNFTASGAVTFNEHASLALTSSTLAVTGGTTTFAADSGATGIDVIAVSSGANLVVAADGISTAALNVPQDATMNALSPVTVTNNADLGSLEIAVGGGSFALTGSDLSDDATARTVTLQGGVTAFSGSINGGGGGGGLSFFQITNDADSGIEAAKTYTHAIDFGNTGAATVDTVEFVNDVNVSAGGRANAGTRTYATSNHQASGTPPGVLENVASVFTDCRYNGPDLGYVELTGLTEGQWYDVRLYDRSWGYQAGNRTYYAVYDVGSDGAVEFTTPKINQNDATLNPPNMPGDVSWAMSYVYQADANGKIKVTIDIADDFTGSYHLYGLTNEETTAVIAGISLPTTTIAATESSTLSLGTAEALTLAGIDVSSGKTLTVDCTSPTIALTNMTLGGDSMVRSTQAANTGDVAVTAATLDLSGGMNYLGDATQLGDPNGDSNATPLTLSDGAIIDWTFDGSGGNTSYLDVKGDITLAGTLTVNILDGVGTASTEDIFIMMARGTITGDVGDVAIDKPAGWDWDSFAIEQRTPSTWALVLKNATFGAVVVQHPGDTDGNGIINDVDLANFELAFGLGGAELIAEGFAFDPDFDDDGDADLDDFVTLRQFFGTNFNDAPAMPDLSQTPEPATMSLLALGALAILRRRSRKT